MFDYHETYQDLFAFMRENKLARWLDSLEPILKHKLQEKPHGDLKRWLDALKALPDITPETVHLNQGRVGASSAVVSEEDKQQLEAGLRGLTPWRKGPFELFGTHIDTEWHSDWKWDRIKDHISPLHNRLILDVGCGSGYHCWRMLGEGAARVVGIDPSFLFLMQFEAIKKYCGPDCCDPLAARPYGRRNVPT